MHSKYKYHALFSRTGRGSRWTGADQRTGRGHAELGDNRRVGVAAPPAVLFTSAADSILSYAPFFQYGDSCQSGEIPVVMENGQIVPDRAYRDDAIHRRPYGEPLTTRDAV